MSVDTDIITPSNYTLNTFFERIPLELDPGILDDGRIVVRIQNRGVWIDNWVNIFPTLEDVYDEEQLKVINGIDSPNFFYITGGNNQLLYPVIELICDDPKILLYSSHTDCRLRRGDEFVAMIRRGEKP